MLAYSSISQIGYILLGVATGSPLGYVGALLHFFNHATFKGLLFVNAAAIRTQTGERAMSNMGGLAARMPFTGVTAIIAFLSAAGIPPLSGFWSKLLIIMALWNVSPALACVALGASVLTLAYLLIMQKKVFFGKAEGAMANATEASRGIVTAEVLLASVNVLVGLAFPLILLYLQSVHML
jgi:multicomponent Na+:H+ antiporter subunit D